MKYELKTKKNDGDVSSFLNTVEDEKRRTDCFEILKRMKNVSGLEPKMWGTNIIGFGTYSYTYKSGHSGEWFRIGFAPRKKNITIYMMQGFDEHKDLMEKLGKFTTGKGCLYIKTLDDIDPEILDEILKKSL